jgi:hypothetical protein
MRKMTNPDIHMYLCVGTYAIGPSYGLEIRSVEITHMVNIDEPVLIW